MTLKKFTRIIILSIFVFSNLTLCLAQEKDSVFVRKGRVLIETGYSYSFLSGIVNGGSGLSILFDDGNSLTSIGFDGGYFVSEDFAIKAKFAILDGGFSSLKNIGLGFKHYLFGNAPIEIGASRLSGYGDAQYMGNISIGGSFRLAENINLEPTIGLVLQDDDSYMRFAFNFAMFL